jgi:regulator of sigma E protease
MTTILAFVFVLGVMIFFHELGHFLVAKKVGVRVEKFSLGFGPKLVGFKKGETEYLISAFPLGGYVKMAGENPGEEITGAKYEFSSRSVLERMGIVTAGPGMNLILAFLFISLVFMIGRQTPKYLTEKPVIGWVEKDSYGELAGLEVGDQIVKINSEPVSTWENVFTIFGSDPLGEFQLVVDRGGTTLTKVIAPQEADEGESVSLGITHYIPPKVGAITPDFPAAKAGLQLGDEIVRIDDTPINHWFTLSEIIHKSRDKTLRLEVQRDQRKFFVNITPQYSPINDVALIGISAPTEMVLRRYGFLESIKQGFIEVGKLLAMTMDFLWKLVTGSASPQNLGGPIMIAKVAGTAAKSGVSDLLYFMGFLSLQLGILNLFPIPILDGGHLLFLFYETARRKPLSLKKQEIAQQVGMLFLIFLMGYVIYNDIMRFVIG